MPLSQKDVIMKSIELKTVELDVLGTKEDFSYRDMLRVLMETPENPQKGAQIDEMRKSLRVLEILDTENKTIELEDADFIYLCNRVKNATFIANNKVFIDFVDYFVGKE